MAKVSRSLPLLLALGLGQNVLASVVTLNPGNFTSGADISNSFSGASLSTLTIPQYPDDFSWPDNVPPLTQSAVYARQCTQCDGTNYQGFVFSPTETGSYPAYNYSEKVARQMTQTSGPQMSGSQALLVNFDDATDFVSVDGGFANNGNYFRLDIWNLAGELLGTCSNAASNSAGCSVQNNLNTWTLSFSSALANIAYITTGGWGGGQYVSGIAFNGADANVPEPSSLAILLSGIIGLCLNRKKFRKQG